MEFNNQISVLTPNNWNTWKHDMQVLLMHYGCWQFIVQTKPEQPDEEATYKEKLDLQLHQFFGTKYQPGEDVGIFISRVKTAATRLQEAGHKLDDLYIGFQLIRWLPQEFQSTVQQIYRWKEEDFRVVKIEAELILEANRLQLMKQDLEKAENAYLSSFTSKKSKTLPGATAAAHGDPNGKNDYQKKGGRKPSVLHLKPFGCLAYAGVPKQIRKKFDMRAKMGIMMGYAQRTKGYRIWLIDENKLVETINDDSDRVKDSLTSRLVSKTSTETPSTSEKPGVSSDNHSLIPCTEVKWIRNIEKIIPNPRGFSDLSEQQEALMVEVTIPNCYKQAIRSRDASKWHDAMDKEINVMKESKVWDLVDHPDNIKILENRWVYTIKYDENNKIVRYKARLVARGNTQLRSESFDEVFQEYKLELSKVKSLKLRCYSDSDFATNRDDRVSMGGFITFL
ncbi:retrovirus-related Pol polyprotein from transposon TNT 1-94 [Trichonephila clavipes]|nr:retrovirus-related Pol polyprotein from transposon TNT 1-94 [Trichonephila clavipes]